MFRLLAIFCLLLIAACSSLPIPVYPPLNLKNNLVLTRQPRVALVLGGGGARGFAHLGVIKALEDAHIPVDLIVGTSSGSLVGSLYAASADISSVTQVMLGSSYPDYVDISVYHAMRGGPIIGNQLRQFIGKNTNYCSIEKTKIPFIAVSTDLNSGRTIAISNGNLALAVNASCAVPSVVQPVKFANITLVDGGVTDPVPVDIARKFNPQVIVAVNIASEPMRHFFLTVPNILVQSMNLMMMSLTSYNLREADIVIRPEVGCAGMFDLSNKEKLYREGLIAGRRAIPGIKKLLSIHSKEKLRPVHAFSPKR